MPRLAPSSLRFVFAGAIALAAASPGAPSASAAPLQSCKVERAIYQFPFDDEYDIEFSRDFLAEKELGKSGILRYRGPTGLVEYDVYTAWAPRAVPAVLFHHRDRKSHRCHPGQGGHQRHSSLRGGFSAAAQQQKRAAVSSHP
jgi:hypothetical protein